MPCQGLNPGVGTSSNLPILPLPSQVPQYTMQHSTHMPYNPNIQQVVPYTGHQHDTHVTTHVTHTALHTPLYRHVTLTQVHTSYMSHNPHVMYSHYFTSPSVHK